MAVHAASLTSANGQCNCCPKSMATSDCATGTDLAKTSAGTREENRDDCESVTELQSGDGLSAAKESNKGIAPCALFRPCLKPP